MLFQHISRLVLVLHPGNEGYRLLLLSSNGAKDGSGGNSETELLKFPYEEDYILSCIDAQVWPYGPSCGKNTFMFSGEYLNFVKQVRLWG